MTFGTKPFYACPACKKEFAKQGALANHGRFSKVCTPEVRFWATVEKRGPDDCWHWQGRKDASGYGRIARKGPMVYAHRVAWIFTNGPVPAGKDVLHRCDQRDCCNPAHYFLGTQRDNIDDCVAKKRTTWGERNPHASVTNEQALEIRAKFRRVGPRECNVRELAEEYGCTPAVVYAIARGRTFKQLSPSGDNDQ